MKVIHIVPSISNEASGPSYSVRCLCESLIGQGQDVTLTTLNLAPVTPHLTFLKTFQLGLGPKKLGRSPALHQWLAVQAESHSVDLIHNCSDYLFMRQKRRKIG